MSKERLGRLEKWILLLSYYKTVLKKLPKYWHCPRLSEVSEPYFDYLFKSDILSNYYRLELSCKLAPRGVVGKEKFRATYEYKKALVSLTIALTRLARKGLIIIYIRQKKPVHTAIKLTEEGIRKVESNFNKWRNAFNC